MRRVLFEVVLRVIQLLALVLTALVLMTARDIGYGDTGVLTHPTWLPRGVGEATVPTVKVVAPYLATGATIALWVLYRGARRAVRREFPREEYR